MRARVAYYLPSWRAVAWRLALLVTFGLVMGYVLTPAPAAAADCSWYDIGCVAGNAVSTAASDTLGALGRSIMEAVGNVIKSLGTIWVHIGTPELAEGSVAQWLRGEVAFYTGLATLVATFFGGAMMALQRRSQPGKDLAGMLLRLVLVNSTSFALLAGLSAASDAFSVWILGQSTNNTDFGQNMTVLLGIASFTGVGIIIAILLGLWALFQSFLQIMLMLARGGLLVMMTGLLPLATSFSNLPAGRAWYQKFVGWTVAGLLYKPAAAIVYSVAFRMAGGGQNGNDGILTVLAGLMVMLFALAAPFALMKLAVPLVAATHLGGGGGGGGGAALAGGVVATGSAVVQARGSGSGGGSTPPPPPAPGPTGSSPTGGPRGSGGSPGPSGAGLVGAAGKAGGSAAGGAGGAGTAGAAGAAGAGAAAGPAGAAVGAGIAAGQAVVGAIKGTANKAADPGGSSA